MKQQDPRYIDITVATVAVLGAGWYQQPTGDVIRGAREPITGVWGRSPQRVQRQSPWWRVSRGAEAESCLSIFVQKRGQKLKI